MKPTAKLIAILLSVTIAQGCLQTNHKWEYKVLNVSPDPELSRTGEDAIQRLMLVPTEEQLNMLGSQGWELVSSYAESETAFPNFGKEEYVLGLQPNVRPLHVVLLFKRMVISSR